MIDAFKSSTSSALSDHSKLVDDSLVQTFMFGGRKSEFLPANRRTGILSELGLGRSPLLFLILQNISGPGVFVLRYRSGF
jgi:hypothetical protein